MSPRATQAAGPLTDESAGDSTGRPLTDESAFPRTRRRAARPHPVGLRRADRGRALWGRGRVVHVVGTRPGATRRYDVTHRRATLDLGPRPPHHQVNDATSDPDDHGPPSTGCASAGGSPPPSRRPRRHRRARRPREHWHPAPVAGSPGRHTAGGRHHLGCDARSSHRPGGFRRVADRSAPVRDASPARPRRDDCLGAGADGCCVASPQAWERKPRPVFLPRYPAVTRCSSSGAGANPGSRNSLYSSRCTSRAVSRPMMSSSSNGPTG